MCLLYDEKQGYVEIGTNLLPQFIDTYLKVNCHFFSLWSSHVSFQFAFEKKSVCPFLLYTFGWLSSTQYFSVRKRMGPTLPHSLSASNSSPTRLSQSSPLYCLTRSFSLCFWVPKLKKRIWWLTAKFLRNHTNICHYFLSCSPFLS